MWCRFRESKFSRDISSKGVDLLTPSGLGYESEMKAHLYIELTYINITCLYLYLYIN